MKDATVEPDSGYNPLGLNNNAPDPMWLSNIHDEIQKGLVERNSFAPLPFKVTTTMTKYDTVCVGVYDADPLHRKDLGLYYIHEGENEMEAEVHYFGVFT